MVSLSFQNIALRLRMMELPETDFVIGIGSGGIVPAALVAFHLNAELRVITLNYRDVENNPCHENPVLLSFPDDLKLTGKKIMLVDDVSVSGKTLQSALSLLSGYEVKTLTIKGTADFVLFPEIKECVKWPWNP